jgi:ATP/maltotriose-dependent transcriptional regulator MalT
VAKSSAPAGVRPGKLAPPELPAGHLARAELERRLDEAAACRVTTVVAGPGFGKSTLVAAWAHDREHAWYGLDGADASPALLARGLATALERVVPGLALASFTERTRAAGNADRNAEAIAAQLADLLAEAVRRDVVLVLDDLQELPVEGAASRLVAAILRSAPPVLHVVLCSREQPPFGLARLRGQGQVASLAADTLAFSEAEVEALLDAAGGPELATLAQHVYELTGGWPAAVRLAAEAMRGQPTLGTEGLERGRLSLFAYLAEEVFGT